MEGHALHSKIDLLQGPAVRDGLALVVLVLFLLLLLLAVKGYSYNRAKRKEKSGGIELFLLTPLNKT